MSGSRGTLNLPGNLRECMLDKSALGESQKLPGTLKKKKKVGSRGTLNFVWTFGERDRLDVM